MCAVLILYLLSNLTYFDLFNPHQGHSLSWRLQVDNKVIVKIQIQNDISVWYIKNILSLYNVNQLTN
jgi:hypothetical protein